MKAVFFDIGGVIVNDHKLREDAMTQLGVSDPDAFWVAFNEAALPSCRGEEPFANAWKRVGAFLDIPVSDELAQNLWVSNYAEKIEIDHEVLEIVAQLRSQCKLGVISNTVEEHAKVLRLIGIYDKFDQVILSHQVGITKDSDRIFDLALERLEVPAFDSVFVDDVERFRVVGEKKGMKGILFTDPSSLRAELRRLGFDLEG